MRPVRNSRRMVRHAAGAHALARRKVALAVEDELVAIDRRVRIRAGNRVRSEVDDLDSDDIDSGNFGVIE